MAQATHVRPEVETVRYGVMRIEVTRGPDAGLALEAAGRTIKVGTAESADLQLHDPTVSREHCELVLDERGFRVQDRDSTNGVRVAGMRIYDITASSKLDLVLGETVLTVTPLPAAEERERASVHGFGQLVGASPAMRELFATLTRIAPSQLSVLIQAETGTGKELVARSIHLASARADKPYIVFDCSVASHGLIESDLFGHERGSFTGASTTRIGALEEADGGTLFLDELGDLPTDLQLKLLRCLQEGEYRRVGGRKLAHADVRVVAATNRDLKAEVAAGRFREDLYYRIEEVTVRVPPLRDRREDIPLLVQHFVSQANRDGAHAELPPSALEMFRAHRWPGNVRELRNVVRRMLVWPDAPFEVQHDAAVPEAGACQLELRGVQRMRAWQRADATSIRPHWLGLSDARREIQDAFELDYLSVLKRLSGSNKQRAGDWAGVSAEAIRKLVAKHGYAWNDAEDA